MLLKSSEAKTLKSNARLRLAPPELSVPLAVLWPSTPLMRTRVNCGPRPRTVIWRPSPASRAIETPGTRWMDSARLASGKSAMSSALITSTTPLARFLTLMALPRLARKPVTTTSSTSAAASGSWATDEVAWIRATGAVEASWIEARWPSTAVRPSLETTVRSAPRSSCAKPSDTV
jgi:hypothetical protein